MFAQDLEQVFADMPPTGEAECPGRSSTLAERFIEKLPLRPGSVWRARRCPVDRSPQRSVSVVNQGLAIGRLSNQFLQDRLSRMVQRLRRSPVGRRPQVRRIRLGRRLPGVSELMTRPRRYRNVNFPFGGTPPIRRTTAEDFACAQGAAGTKRTIRPG